MLLGTQSKANVTLLPGESGHPLIKPSKETKGNEASLGAARHVAGAGGVSSAAVVRRAPCTFAISV